MLILNSKQDEWVRLWDKETGRQLGRLKAFLKEGQTRLAFDIPENIQVTREKVFEGTKDGKIKR